MICKYRQEIALKHSEATVSASTAFVLLRAEPLALRIAIRFLAGDYAPGHLAGAAGSRHREQVRAYDSR